MEEGRRVYVPSKTAFGNVVKEGGILGLPASYAVVDDVGNKLVFFGDQIDFVYVDTSKDSFGKKCQIPIDVVSDMKTNFAPGESKKMIHELYSLSPEERLKAFDKKVTRSKKKSGKSSKSSKKRV